MDVSRAQEILHSEDKIDVRLDGVPVWIDSVNTEQATAKVHPQNGPVGTQVVPVQELREVQ